MMAVQETTFFEGWGEWMSLMAMPALISFMVAMDATSSLADLVLMNFMVTLAGTPIAHKKMVLLI